jgi:hypothetical protein
MVSWYNKSCERERAWYENIRTVLEWPQHSHYPLKKTEPAGFISLRLSKEVIKFDFSPSRSCSQKDIKLPAQFF